MSSSSMYLPQQGKAILDILVLASNKQKTKSDLVKLMSTLEECQMCLDLKTLAEGRHLFIL